MERKIINVMPVIAVLKEVELPKDNNTPPSPELALRRCAAVGNLSHIKILTANVEDLDIHQSGPSGKTALNFAQEYDQKAVVEFLGTLNVINESTRPSMRQT